MAFFANISTTFGFRQMRAREREKESREMTSLAVRRSLLLPSLFVLLHPSTSIRFSVVSIPFLFTCMFCRCRSLSPPPFSLLSIILCFLRFIVGRVCVCERERTIEIPRELCERERESEECCRMKEEEVQPEFACRDKF